MKSHPLKVIELCSEASGTGSRKLKKSYIEDWFDNPSDPRPVHETELWKVVEYANNPWYNYYVTVVPGLSEISVDARRRSKQAKSRRQKIFETGPQVYGWTQQFDTMFKLLDDLKDRKLPPNSSQARQAILEWAKHCGAASIEVFRRILRKDLKMGMKASSFNAIHKGWVPEFKVQLAQPFNEKKLQFPCYVDPKFDGERCLAFITTDGAESEVTYFSRNGNQFFNYGCFDDELIRLFKGEGNIVVDCEAINRQGFQSLMKAPKYFDPNFDTTNLRLVVFDFMPQQNFESCSFDETQESRYVHLKSYFKRFNGDKVKLVDTRMARDWAEAERIYEYWVEQGLEGIILKQPDGEYEFKRSYTWMKLKPQKSEDVKIVGMELGRQHARFEGKCGSLIIERNDPDRGPVRVNVASGFTDYMHNNIVEVGDQILYTKPGGEVINLKDEVVEVTFDCITDEGSFRFPRFKRRGDDLIRSDKTIVGA